MVLENEDQRNVFSDDEPEGPDCPGYQDDSDDPRGSNDD